MPRLFGRYRHLERHIVYAIIAEAFLQLLNTSFVLILLIYMEKLGYPDHEAAAFFKYRFIGVLFLAYPLGRFIKGRKIKPIFMASCIGLPIFSYLIIEAAELHLDWLLYVTQIIWGVFLMAMQVSILPYILRNARPDTHTEAISLSFSTWSFTTVIGGAIIFGLQSIDQNLFNEGLVLKILSVLALPGIYFIWKINITENVNASETKADKRLDWPIIRRAMLPNIVIAVGAGLTIPFVGLFFYKIHGVDSNLFSLLAVITTVVVFFAVMATPAIKNRFGYAKAIPVTQSIAILMLIGMALTEYLQGFWLAGWLAALFYLLRQPLMNLAGPMTSEFTLKYVGKRNEEIMSALQASIWSGSWFFSGLFFQFMRSREIPYMNIFLITAGLYIAGVVLYVGLIRSYNRRSEPSKKIDLKYLKKGSSHSPTFYYLYALI